jgi:hypothetical protein
MSPTAFEKTLSSANGSRRSKCPLFLSALKRVVSLARAPSLAHSALTQSPLLRVRFCVVLFDPVPGEIVEFEVPARNGALLLWQHRACSSAAGGPSYNCLRRRSPLPTEADTELACRRTRRVERQQPGGENEVILERALLAFHRSSCPLQPMVAVLGCLVDCAVAVTQGELLTCASLVEVAEANRFPARSVICGTHFLTHCDICHA